MKNTRQIGVNIDQNGQGMVEYILVLVAVIVVLMVVLGPGGMLAGQISSSLETGVSGIDCMVQQECLDPTTCTPSTGSGCGGSGGP